MDNRPGWGKLYNSDITNQIKTGDRINWRKDKDTKAGTGVVTAQYCGSITVQPDKGGDPVNTYRRLVVSVQRSGQGDFREFVGY